MTTRDIAKQAIAAAVYAAVSLCFSPLSYGAVQFRFAEALKVIPFYDKKYTVGLTLGCFIVNLFSPMGIADIVFGTAATLITCLLASKMKKLIFAPPVTAVVTGLIVGIMLNLVLGLPLLWSMAGVAAGQLCVVGAGAVGTRALMANKAIRRFL